MDRENELVLHKTETLLRGWYEDCAPLDTLLADADPVELSVIGEGTRMFFDSPDSLRKWWTREDRDRRAPRRLSDLSFTVIPLHAAALVLARWQCAEGNDLRRQRGTFLWKTMGGRLRLLHLHISQPWDILWGHENFPVTVGRMNYEYITTALHSDEKDPPPRVPARQRRVLRCLRAGMTYEEIGEILSISPRTVRYYVNELIHRFRVDNRSQLLAASERLENELRHKEKEREETL